MASALLVCASCWEGLIALGAEPITEKRIGSLLDRCETHPGRHAVLATRRILAEGSTVGVWLDSYEPEPDPFPPLARDEVGIVAQLAATLLAGGPAHEATGVDVEQAVVNARKILAATKGEAIT